MYCNQCDRQVADNARFCEHCGATLQVETQHAPDALINNPKPAAASENTVPLSPVRPWVRYWARMFDLYLLAIIAGFAVGIVRPRLLEAPNSTLLFGLAVLLAWVFLESILLATIHTTPGKWLLRINLIPPTNRGFSYGSSLSRSRKVWWRGLGIGFPIVSVGTLIVAHSHLKKLGITSWDRDGGFTVTHRRIGPLRTIVVMVFFLCFLVLSVVGQMDQTKNNLASNNVVGEAALRKASDEVNATLPKMLDKYTRLDRTVVGPGKRFMYVYTLVSLNSTAVSQQRLQSLLGTKIRTDACMNKSLKATLDDGVELVYRYQGNDGATIGDIVVQQSDCR